MASPKKPPKAARIDEVTAMLRNMVPYSVIQQQLSLRWGMSRASIMGIIRRVHADWAVDAATVSDTRRHQIRNGFEQLFMQAQGAKKLDLAARILGELARLDGCIAPTAVNMQVQGQVGVGVGISLGTLGFKSPDEVRARIDELQNRLKTQGPIMLTGGQALSASLATLANLPTPTGTSADDDDLD